jgi:hypothetical protein
MVFLELFQVTPLGASLAIRNLLNHNPFWHPGKYKNSRRKAVLSDWNGRSSTCVSLVCFCIARRQRSEFVQIWLDNASTTHIFIQQSCFKKPARSILQGPAPPVGITITSAGMANPKSN